MADVLLDEQSVPSTPSAGQGVFYFDSTASLPAFVNDGGRKDVIGTTNCSIANQSPGASDAYLTDSDLLIPSFGFQARSMFRWFISCSKGAAGAVAPIWQVRIGANRTTADTSRLSITGSAQTAAADAGVFCVQVSVRSVAASGVLQGTIWLNHNLAATGLASNASGVVEATSAGFDNTALAGLYIGLSVNGGTSSAWTITQVRSEAKW